MTYFLDTNTVVGYLRRNAVAKIVTKILDLTDDTNEIFLPVVNEGELWSIAAQRQWGHDRRRILADFIATYQRADISDEQTIERYAYIDAFSQNKLLGRPLNKSARNMGKNDLWAVRRCGSGIGVRSRSVAYYDGQRFRSFAR